MYKLCFYVPHSHLEAVKAACFAAGAGRIGNYDCCAWQVPGEGQFRPLVGSRPYLGTRDAIEVVVEYKVEMVCDGSRIKAAVDSLLEAHPYEEPAFEVYKLAQLDELPHAYHSP